MNRVVFKDELCDAKWNDAGSNTIEVTCHKGTLRVTGSIVVQFQGYHSWCKDCERKRVVDRKDLKEAFNSIAQRIEKELEEG